jgi:flagellar hook-associated protein 2
VDVTVQRDIESIVTEVKTFAKTFNDALDQIHEFTKYVPETNERGILMGNNTVQQAQAALYAQFTRAVNGTGLNITRPAQIGLTIGSGARLQVDDDRLREALENDPEAVAEFFSKVVEGTDGKVEEVGFAARFKTSIEGLTDQFTGSVSRAADAMSERVELFNNRAAQLQTLLNFKEQRLYAQFQAMERALAGLQGQQAALASLANAVNSFGGGGGLGLG